MEEKQTNEQKKSSTSEQVKEAAKKVGVRKAIKKILLKVVIFLLPIILLALLFYSVISLVADFFSGIAENIADFFTLDSTGGIIITDESIDQIIESMKNDLNISPEDLNLLGDIDYNDPDQEEAIKEAERKYIRLFLEAQETTQSINDGGFFGTGLGSEGSVYIKKVKNGATDTNDLTDMSPISMEDLQKKIDNGANDVWNYFSINSSGQLVVPVMNNGTISTTTIDYKSMISQYSTPWNFFIDLEMIVQNPKFMEAFVDLIKDSKINLTIVYNTTYTKETIVHEYKVTETIKDKNGNDVEITTTKTDTTVNEYENRNPMLVITTANTWIYSREAVYKATTNTTTEGPIVEGNEDDKTTTTIETTTTYSQEGATKEEYNGGQKGEDGTFVGLLDKSFKIPNSSRTAKAGDSLVSGAEMLFELLERSSNTASWSDVMRYVLYMYTGKDYGVTEFDVSWFSTNTMTGIVSGNAFLEFLKVWEGTLTDSEGNYLVADDGRGIPTVGFGIALMYNVDRFEAKGVTGVENWQIGDNCYKDYGVSNSIIDEIMLEEISDWKESVRKATSACVPPLNEQQIDALTVISYQYGNIGNFVSQWNKYGNTDELKDAVYSGNGQWKYYFKQNPSIGRAEANWKLFHEGIYTDKEGNEIVGGSGTEGSTQVSGINIATYTSSSGKTYIQYKQGVGPWAGQRYGDGTIGQQGCSVTAIAIALSGYGYNFTPSNFSGQFISISSTTAQYATGSKLVYTRGSDGLAYNQVQSQHKQDIVNHLKTGNAVIYHVLGSKKGYSSNYTSNQHWMVLTDVSEDGTQAYVSNPNSAGPNGWNNIDTILQSLCCYIKVSM